MTATMDIINFEELLTVTQAATILGIHVNTLRTAITRKKIKVIKLGRGYKIQPDELQKYVMTACIIEVEK